MIMGWLLTMIGNIAHIVEPKSDEFALVWIIIRLFIAAIDNKIEEEIAKKQAGWQSPVKVPHFAVIHVIKADQFVINDSLAQSGQPISQRYFGDTTILKNWIFGKPIQSFVLGSGW